MVKDKKYKYTFSTFRMLHVKCCILFENSLGNIYTVVMANNTMLTVAIGVAVAGFLLSFSIHKVEEG